MSLSTAVSATSSPANPMQWLTTLVWPEQKHRRQRLRAAIAVARADPPNLVAGDLLNELPKQIEQAAEHGLVVVFHSAVIAYLTLTTASRSPR